jgi:nitrate reductase (NAD(P)H)
MATTTTQTQVASDIVPFKNGEITVEDIIPSPAEPNVPLPPPSKNPVDILDVDKGTPDSHVPRDPRLIRLTGVHPFNVEPPLTALYNEGMPSIHFFHSLNEKANNQARVSHIAGIILCSEPWTSAPGPR